ncbi:DUF3027 domain-containing protein [Nakamurella antarctica]|uniref:DUF3027 domain-containing protein n=1 Tax=Nakamurella antarctica TaxID=1902245 RepID=UPI0019D156F1|nr:DUF3027 domain-containing protein [Nakamurella antarctica]
MTFAVVTADSAADPHPTESVAAPLHPRASVQISDTARDLARAAATEEALRPSSVGDFLDAVSEDDVAISVRFAVTDAGYAGWAWTVTVAIVPDAQPTISEVVMLPGDGALLAPEWLPWNERIRAGDLGVGDVLLPIDNDPRLVPAYLQSDDPAIEDLAHELGIGRVRVMGRIGRQDAAARWREGEFGPDSEMAKAAPVTCVQCAFYLPLAGSLGAVAGACGNEMSPADGRVVDSAYGCGAGSEVRVELIPSGFGDSMIDENTLDVHPKMVVDGPQPLDVDPRERFPIDEEPAGGQDENGGGESGDGESVDAAEWTAEAELAAEAHTHDEAVHGAGNEDS